MDDDTHSGAVAQQPPVAFLTPKDVQRELRIGEKLAYRLLRDGAIPSVRVGNLYHIHRRQLEETLLKKPELSKKDSLAGAQV